MNNVFRKDAICSKCGTEDVSVAWCPGTNSLFGAMSVVEVGAAICRRILKRKGKDGIGAQGALVDLVEGEHLHRVCTCCHYSWLEIPLDQAHALVQLAAQAE